MEGIDFAKMKALIVDDMFNMRQTLKNMLRHIGFTNLVDADNGEKAWSIVQGSTIDFIICDWNMPKMAGLEFLGLLRNDPKYRDIPFLMITAEVSESRIVQAAETDVDGYLIKPFVATTLDEKIKNILESKINPSPFEKNMKDGHKLLEESNTDEAISKFQEAFKLRPESARVRQSLGEAFKAKKDFKSAERWFKDAVEANPQYIRGHESLGEMYITLGDKEKAADSLAKASDISPDNSTRQVKLGKLFIDGGKPEKAEQAFRKAMSTDTAGPEVHTQIGEIYLEAGDETKAAAAFKSSLSIQKDVHVYNRLGIALRKKGKFGDAVAEYNKALLIAPDDEVLYYNLGRVYIEMKKYDKAITALNQALKLDPEFEECKGLISRIKEMSG